MFYKPKKFASLIGISVKTLQRWDKSGLLIARRSPTNRRYYTDEDIQTYRERTNRKSTPQDESLCKVGS